MASVMQMFLHVTEWQCIATWCAGFIWVPEVQLTCTQSSVNVLLIFICLKEYLDLPSASNSSEMLMSAFQRCKKLNAQVKNTDNHTPRKGSTEQQ